LKGTSRLDEAAVDRVLIDALFSQAWDETLRGMETRDVDESGARRIREIVSASTAWHSRCQSATTEIVATLQRQGVDAVVEKHVTGAQGTITIRVAPEDIGPALDVATTAGFLMQRELSPGALRAVPHSISELSLIPTSPPLTRLKLVWALEKGAGALARIFRPTLADLVAVRLPGLLWPLYWAIRPYLAIRRRRKVRGGAPFVATPPDLVEDLLAVLELEEGELLADLGCGDGRVLIEAAQIFDCRGLGIESNPVLAERARANVASRGLQDSIDIVTARMEEADLSQVSAVFLFLPPNIVQDILPSLLQRLPRGARVLAHEQSGIAWHPRPVSQRLVVEPAGITVASVWTIGDDG
jgi:hypothetical protein